MANFVFNISKGAVTEKIRDGANIQVIALSATGIESDAVLLDKDFFSDTVSGATDEATNTGYARKSISNASVTLTIDDTLDKAVVDIADQTWTGVAATPNWSALVTVEDAGGVDTARMNMTKHDFAVTPDGSDITAQVANFFQAT